MPPLSLHGEEQPDRLFVFGLDCDCAFIIRVRSFNAPKCQIVLRRFTQGRFIVRAGERAGDLNQFFAVRRPSISK